MLIGQTDGGIIGRSDSDPEFRPENSAYRVSLTFRNLRPPIDQRRAGHPGFYREGGADYLLFHAYSASTGRSRLHISTIAWQDGWPKVARLP